MKTLKKLRGTFLGTAKPEIMKRKTSPSRTDKNAAKIIEFDNDFHKFVRRRQFLTFSVLEVC